MISPLAQETADVSEVVNSYFRWRLNSARAPSADETNAHNPILVGVDIGQMSDYTAIIVAEISRRDNSEGETFNHYTIRKIERVPLGTSYADVVKRCRDIYDKLSKHKRLFIVDASGSRPIIDLFRAADMPILPIQITAGTTSRIEHGMGYVSKLELASTLQIISSAKRVHLPKFSKFANAIRDEARRFELRVTDSGNLTFAGEGRSKDDLIMALTYILWYGERKGGFDRARVRWI